jgi:enediyne biosynthesis protein E4
MMRHPRGRRSRLVMAPLLLLLAAAAAATSGCTGESDADATARTTHTGPQWFADVTNRAGIAFRHDPGPSNDFFMPEQVGSGAALFDCDNDGRLDVYLINNAGPDSASVNRFYRQQTDGTFRDATAGSGLDVAGHGMGVAAGDVNNDGLTDLLVTEYLGARLLLNRRDGKFANASRAAGIENAQWGTSAAFVDYDRDGWLDLVVANYVKYTHDGRICWGAALRDYCHPNAFEPTIARLLRNLGPGDDDGAAVRFEDVTDRAGWGQSPSNGLGVACADFTGDGWPDVLIANDEKPNHLWVNRRDGTFADEAVARGLAYNALGEAQANMGIALGDVQGDGLPDAYITHLDTEGNVLWAAQQPGLYQDATVAAALSTPKWRGTGFGTVLADFDNDGAPDLAVVNGRIGRLPHGPRDPKTIADIGPHWTEYAESNQLFANDGTGRFRDVSDVNPAFCTVPNVGRGLAVGDVDNDGGLDLLVTAVGAPARLYRNVAPARGHWLIVRATAPAWGGRDALGAEITVRFGRRRMVALANPSHSYLVSNDPRAHFGLGAATAVDEVRVRWPDGSVESFPGGAADRIIELPRGGGTVVSAESETAEVR